MFTLKQAKLYAKNMEFVQKDGERWLVFKTPYGAPINQAPANLYNKGRYHCCRASERPDYEAGGAAFID